MDFASEVLQQCTARSQDFSPNKIECLNTCGSLIEHANTRISDILLYAPLFDVAVTTKTLQSEICRFKARFGKKGFSDGCHKRQHIFRCFSFSFVSASFDDIYQLTGVCDHHTPALRECLLSEKHAPDIGVHDNGVSRTVGIFRASNRTHL